MKTAIIAGFSGRYRFLSNFYSAPLTYEGIRYPTSEHAYQATKTLDLEARRRISEMPTPGEAKRAGQLVALRDDWEEVHLAVMEEILRLKFRRGFASLLKSTGKAWLQEENTWGDRYWGTVNGQGYNHLGKILMKIRDDL